MATYYWVNGAGTWNNTTTTNWATTSGGAGGAGVPTNADTVNFDANSGTGTVSVAATAVSLNTTLNNANINLSLTGSPTLCTAAGTLTLTLGTITLNNLTLTCGIFRSTNSNTRTIAFGTGNITLTGNNATIWTLATATGFTYTGTPIVNCTYSGSTGTRTINAGGNATISEATAVSFNITNGTDTVAIGTSQSLKNIDFTGFAGTLSNASGFVVYGNYKLSTGMTLTAGTGGTTFQATSGTQQITTNGKTLDFPLAFNGIGGTFAFQDALTQGSTRTFTLTNGTLQFKNGTTNVVGAFATSGTNLKYLQSTSAGSQATLSQASGTVNANYLTIKDSNATGGAIFNAFTDAGSSLSANNINSGNNTGWNFIPSGSSFAMFF